MTTVLLTRPTPESEKSRPLFETAGFAVKIQPAIEILPAADFAALDTALQRLGGWDRLIFSSVNGVRFFCDRAEELGVSLCGRRLAAVGPATADALRLRGLCADTIPTEYRAEGLVSALADEAQEGKRFLCVRGDRGRNVLKAGLESAGGAVAEISVYRSVDVARADPEISAAMSAGALDWTTATSPAIARSLVRLFGETLRQTRLASISPLTSEAFEALGFSVTRQAACATMEGICDAIRG